MGQRAETLMVSNIPANAVRDIFLQADTGESQLRFVPTDFGTYLLTIAIVASAVGIELTLLAGERTLLKRSTLEAGGTTGVFPNMDQKAMTFEVYAGEILSTVLRETAGAATTDVMMSASLDPAA